MLPVPAATVVGTVLALALSTLCLAQSPPPSVAAALPERVAAHDASRAIQQQIDALRGTGPSQAQRVNDQALATALATARARLEQAESQAGELNRRLDAQRQTRAGLVPLLEQMLNLLEQSIRADLPIDTARRLAGVDEARTALNDAQLSATQRFETVLDLYHQELRLNYTTQNTAGVLTTDRGPRAVRLLRVGRIALFALSSDLSYCAVFERDDNIWEELSDGLCQQLDALGNQLEQAPLDGLPLSLSAAP